MEVSQEAKEGGQMVWKKVGTNEGTEVDSPREDALKPRVIEYTDHDHEWAFFRATHPHYYCQALKDSPNWPYVTQEELKESVR